MPGNYSVLGSVHIPASLPLLASSGQVFDAWRQFFQVYHFFSFFGDRVVVAYSVALATAARVG